MSSPVVIYAKKAPGTTYTDTDGRRCCVDSDGKHWYVKTMADMLVQCERFDENGYLKPTPEKGA